MVTISPHYMPQKHLCGANRENSGPLFRDEPRSILGGSSCLQRHHKLVPPNSLSHSTDVLSALEDLGLELSQFLPGSKSNSINGDKEMQSIWFICAAFYTLTLEPLEIWSKWVIMRFEAHAIFGALFINSVWIIYEWGNANKDGEDNSNVY